MHIVDSYVKATEKGENRDNSTGGHMKRKRTYVNLILHGMRHNKRYQDNDKIKQHKNSKNNNWHSSQKVLRIKTMKHKSKETGGNVIMNKKMAIVRTEYVMLPRFGAIC